MPIIKKQSPVKKVSKSSHANSVLDRIEDIGFDEDEGIKVLLYGKSGTGKTTLWATFPGPTLAVICSGGLRPGELRSINTPDNRKKIKTVTLQESGECKELIDFQNETETYNTVVLDHSSGLQDKVLAEILGIEELPAQKSWGMATQQDYGQCTLQCKGILRGFLSLKCNVVIIAQEREFNVESDSELIAPSVGAALTPSLTGWLNPAVDYICQTYIRPKMVDVKTKVGDKVVVNRQRGKGVEYCLRVEPHDLYTTKFRLPRGKIMPECIVDPSYDKIMELILE